MGFTMNAVYRDHDGNHYNVPLAKDGASWKLQTQLGPRAIDYYVMSGDTLLEFVDYKLDAPRGLRGCDYGEINKAWRAQLPWPQKPPVPPQSQTSQPDSRLHVEQQPGESRHAALQRAYAEQQIAEQRKQRQQSRMEMEMTVDAARVAETRAINNQFADRLKPKREIIPPPILSKETIGALAEEARYRKRKIESQE